MATESVIGAIKARMVLQQCLSARLQVEPGTECEEAKYVEIGKGLIIYVCFMKGATEEMVQKMVKCALTTCLSQLEDPSATKRVSVLDLPGDVLIIPQATLGGIPKGKSMQYHKNIAKEDGKKLYANFVSLCEATLHMSEKAREQEKQVRAGTYGNIQVFRTDTNGPFTHLLEF
ncbi:probable D-tyrosyl-tRNA(Tyr) deacylase 2 [Mizuhopecten yessoensis]|uniref:D-aminoacyl-tRNA deacylase n=1 Tax=Mizuhopecten yessoensis TaxID=6573 RepID=A0A210QB08_MIZYE|nr:probable D-tyrosyl-tRNA(Tyr) deacylase 2 [Mizuhopecten yessoensis]OWF45920.1 D-tyrosyl-tRNA(Tyr) deacylase 2 [Mizuhopecten yessoensis]